MTQNIVDLQPEVPYHTYTISETEAHLKSNIIEGLTSEEAAVRIRLHGTNELKGSGGVLWYKVLWRQVANPLVVVLLIANILAFATKQFPEGGVILFIIIMNATIGFYQDFSAEQTMDALRNMSSPTSQVIRDESRIVIPNSQVVPGDIMIFEDGAVIGADCRLLEVFNLETDEALLTGESLPVMKTLDVIKNAEQSLGDRLNMVFASTTVVKGRAKGIVTTTGMGTQIGKIATTLMNVDTNELTPLQKRLNKMAYFIFVAAVVLVIVVFAVHKFHYSNEIAIYAISVAISMIPQGLVAIVTLTMAFGVSRMAKAKAIVRRLSSLESLGAVTNICSDKTGTLTQSKMVAVRMWLPDDGYYRMTGTGFAPAGDILRQGEPNDSNLHAQEERITPESSTEQLLRVFQASALCNMAELRRANHPETHGEWTAIGDPTEIALQVLAHKAGMPKPELVEDGFQLITEFPFDSAVKRMSVLYKAPSSNKKKDTEHLIFTKGATERILACCSHYRDGEAEIPFKEKSDAIHSDFVSTVMERVDHLAEQGLRVLSVSYRKFHPTPGTDLVHGLDRDDVESNLVFLGLIGIYDPPRAESLPAVMKCYEAGIRVHMLTGDHPSTAAAIAKEVAIIPADTDIKNSSMVMSADKFDAMSDDQIDALNELPRVVARCSPNTKVKMIAALHRRNLFAAMTGDGVNDSPSLKAANVGIAMGQSGSDVAKQAADIVLTDDNFATIVEAIAEGRRMFFNIQKFVQHLMSGNIATILVLVVSLAIKDKQQDSVFPLSAAAILFMNLCYSSPPAIGLGLEPASETNMTEPPRTSKQGLFSFEVLMDMFVYGIAMAVLSFVPFILVLFVFENGELGYKCNVTYSEICDGVFRARATCYATLTFLILSHAINCRDIRQSGWQWSRLKTAQQNKTLWLAIVIGAMILFPVIYVPGLNKNVFKHEGISYEWGLVFGMLFIYTAFVETYKFVKRRTMA
ncbi:P-type Na+/K+ transporter [Entomortierella parvispora]|uniref:P-type Na(+) transporter n=1 Tax=Entomortierella parvispora TaxID=205924 RepID=A0A9P3HCU7_9FUNG|nr:P-type Na+/K+ transporter [Entomortierella parvispora]